MWHRHSCDGCAIFTAEQSRFKVMNKYYADCRNIVKNEAAAQITQLIMFILRMADFSNFIDVHFFCNLACLTLWSVCVYHRWTGKRFFTFKLLLSQLAGKPWTR